MPVSVTFEVPDAALADAVAVCEDWYGLRLTSEQLADVLKASPLAALEVADGLDTLGRERLIDAIVEHVGMPEGSSWPINADDESVSAAFYSLFALRCEERGYQLLWTEP